MCSQQRRLLTVSVCHVLLDLSGVLLAARRAEGQLAASINGGRRLYHQYCASCHGLEGKGDGPAADALKVAPPDLTVIQKAGERFPSRKVIDSIEGEKLVAAHGSRVMPIRGKVFRRAKSGKLKEPLYIYNLVNYLESIQVNNVTSK